MFNYLRHKLGLDKIQEAIIGQSYDILNIHNQLRQLRSEKAVDTLAIGRLIAILNPIFAVDEADPKRKAASDEIGNRIIARIKVEYAATAPYNKD